MSSPYANNIRVLLDFILALGSIVIATYNLLGALFFFGSFGKCAQVMLIFAPISLLVAASSVFIERLTGQLRTLFVVAIASGLIFFGEIAFGNSVICAETIDVKIGAWPFAALILLATRIAFLTSTRRDDA